MSEPVEERTIKFIGVGVSLPGVPARNLTEAEYELHKAAIDACPAKLYKVPRKSKKKESAPVAAKETEKVEE